MQGTVLAMTVCGTLLLLPPLVPAAQAQPTLPSFTEVEAAWTGFWTAVILGDLEGARKYIHSQRQHLFPGKRTLAELQEIAQQMAFCRLDPTPFPLSLLDEATARQFGLSERERARPLPPGSLDELIYRVYCEHRGEKAETQVGVRRDWDGVWRFSAL